MQEPAARPAPDLLERDFTAAAPNLVWVADITYVRCYDGWLYLAIVIDLFSRKIVGWSMRDTLEAEIVSDALAMAVARRRPAAGVVHHSDRGSQYTSLLMGRTLRELGVVASMGSRGCAYDNAACESAIGTIKLELVEQHVFATRDVARLRVFDYIEAFYNPLRMHTTLGDLSPNEYEAAYHATPTDAAIAARNPVSSKTRQAQGLGDCWLVRVRRMERVVTVEFGPSRSKRFGKAVAEAGSGAGECSELAPNRYRTRFALGRDGGAYIGLARLLERVRHWRATEVYEDDELLSADHAREMAWCASAQLKAFGECRFRFELGVLPRCSLCPLFDAERAIRDVLGENGPGGMVFEIRLGPRVQALLRGESPSGDEMGLDRDWRVPDFAPAEWRNSSGEERAG